MIEKLQQALNAQAAGDTDMAIAFLVEAVTTAVVDYDDLNEAGAPTIKPVDEAQKMVEKVAEKIQENATSPNVHPMEDFFRMLPPRFFLLFSHDPSKVPMKLREAKLRIQRGHQNKLKYLILLDTKIYDPSLPYHNAMFGGFLLPNEISL